MISMDFFKSCKTNVHRINHIYETRCLRFSQSQESDGQEVVYDVLEMMRTRKTLCANAGRHLWIFLSAETSEPAVSQLVTLLSSTEYGLCLEQNTTLEVEQARTLSDGRPLQDILLQAVEAALSFSLVQEDSCFHVAPWTWMVCGLPGEPSFALTLSASISSTGVLHVTASIETTASVTMAEHESNTDTHFILSPSGHAILVIHGNQGLNSKEEFWKKNVVSKLRASGTFISDDDEWLRVRLKWSAHANDFLWPSKLVLAASTSFRSLNINSDQDLDHWFISAGDMGGYQSPLAEAESWLTKISNDREINLLTDGGQASFNITNTDDQIESTDVDTMLETSPPFHQRNADHQAAMVGIYPTPPDGLVPGQTQSQLPGPDNAAALASVDSSTIGNELLAATDAHHESDQSLDSFNAPSAGFQPNADDLFGDMGEMDDFTREEVGDADFSFFDEPDEIASPDPQTNLEIPEALPGVPVTDGDERRTSLDSQSVIVSASGSQNFDNLTTSQDNTIDQFPGPDSISESVDNHDLGRPVFAADTMPLSESEKPLSPFGIRERLLPPPIPASAQRHSVPPAPTLRRSTTFDPVIFNDGLESTFKYTQCEDYSEAANTSFIASRPDISLPSRRRKDHSMRNTNNELNATDHDEGVESEDDSYESDSIPSIAGYAPKLPWSSKKRKRDSRETSVSLINNELDSTWSGKRNGVESAEERLFGLPVALLNVLDVTAQADAGTDTDWLKNPSVEVGLCSRSIRPPENDVASTENLIGLGKLDVVYVAQLIGEQALCCSLALIQAATTLDGRRECQLQGYSTILQARAAEILSQLFPSTEACDVPGIALAIDRITSVVQARTGQPRLPQRADSLSIGPEIFTFPAPYVRVRRGQEIYEMLSPALDFWEPLSLGPPNGHKNVKAFCILPSNSELRSSIRNFIDDVGSVYESCKLGTHQQGSFIVNDSTNVKIDGSLALIDATTGYTYNSLLQSYRSICPTLGTLLSAVGCTDAGKTIVVYMVDPFDDARASQILCACFWLLYKAYRESLHKHHRGESCSDVVLQILPIALVAKSHMLSFLDRGELATLAKEIYDRCPPSLDIQKAERGSKHSLSSPFVELAPVLPRKIQFQLAADPPSDLLHEGSVLHLAYAMSADHHWMTVHWINGTGSHQRSSSFSIRGRSYAEVIEEVWHQTCEAMAARAVMWRVFILCSDVRIESSVQQCWRKVVAERPRKQVLSVTLLTSQTHLPINILPPSFLVEPSANLLTAAFPTPATTPSGTILTASPDTNPHASAPLTPAPSESVVPAETDLDAYLVDTSDETFGMLFASAYKTPTALASGALFKRGSTQSIQSAEGGSKPLPSLGVSVLWTVHVRPTGQVDEGGAKHAEMTLKDVLRMYRGLTVFTKAKGLVVGDDDVARPIHLVAVLRAAQALDGLLR
nr:mediator of rna polymerase ii transcription subunit 13 [Quercus suber]